MYAKEQIKLLPKIEISFQDDFSGSEREFTLTPHYILRRLEEMNIVPKIGDEVLLFEKDINAENNQYYMCHIGKISEADKDLISRFPSKEFTKINGKIITITLEKKGFDLSINDPIFSE